MKADGISECKANTDTDLDNQMEEMLDVALAISAQRHIDGEGLGERERLVQLRHLHRVDVYELRFGAAFDVDDFLPQHIRHQFPDNIIFDLHDSTLRERFDFTSPAKWKALGE